jgi:hypothetical protein
MEIAEKILDIIGKFLLFVVIIWVVGYKIFYKIWEKITIAP